MAFSFKHLRATKPMVSLVSYGYGVKTMTQLFEEKGYYWETVVDLAFKSKGMTHDDALLNVRLAKILHTSDYDFINKRFVAFVVSHRRRLRPNHGARVPGPKRIEDLLEKTDREDIITVFMGSPGQCISYLTTL